MPEYIPWYQPGAPLVQCTECFALVVSGNTQGHDEWHERLMATFKVIGEDMSNHDAMIKTGIAQKKKGTW